MPVRTGRAHRQHGAARARNAKCGHGWSGPGSRRRGSRAGEAARQQAQDDEADESEGCAHAASLGDPGGVADRKSVV